MGVAVSRSYIVQCATSEMCCGGETDLREPAEKERRYFDTPPDVVVIEVRPEVSKKTT